MAYRAVRCRIPELCSHSGIELQKLAALAQINVTQLSDYCHMRKVMGVEIAKAIAAVLKCSIDDLYEWEFFYKVSGTRKGRQ